MQDEMIVVPIVLACDRNMLMQTLVVIASVLEHRKKKYALEFYILFPQNENEDEGKKYISDLYKKYSDFTVQFIKIDNIIFKNVTQHIENITVPTNYRLLIPELLKQWKKCIYLDADICVVQDIWELWQEDIDNVFLAGVVSDGFAIDEELKKRYVEEFHFTNVTTYLNAGVLLLNLNLLREYNMTQIWLELINSRDFYFGDQDVINYACKDKVRLLPYKYNVCVKSYSRRRKLAGYRGMEDIENAYEKPVIIHFAGHTLKPWDNLVVMYAEQWWKSAQFLLANEELKELYQKALDRTKEIFLISLEEKMKEYEQCIILGFGNKAREVIDFCEERKIQNIICCCDNDETKWGKFYKGIECKALEETVMENKGALYINSVQSSLYRKELEQQVLALGVTYDKIEMYHNIHPLSINSVESRFYAVNEEKKIDINMIKEYLVNVSIQKGLII